jgi:hypothetical protein
MSSNAKKPVWVQIFGLLFDAIGRFGHWFFIEFLPRAATYVWTHSSSFSEFIIDAIETKTKIGMIDTHLRQGVKFILTLGTFIGIVLLIKFIL